MNSRILFGLTAFLCLPFFSFSADGDKKAPPVDIQALAQRFDAEAKPFFTVDKSTTFVKVGGGFTYLPANSIVPVLDGIMKVNGFFCNKAMSELAEASTVVESAMKNCQAAADELDDLKNKVDAAKENFDSLDGDMQMLERRLEKLRANKTANTQQLSLDLGKKRNELSDAKREFKRLAKDFDKKKEIPEDLKKKADTVKAGLDDFLANQKKLAAKPEDKPEEKKVDDGKAPAKKEDIPAPNFK